MDKFNNQVFDEVAKRIPNNAVIALGNGRRIVDLFPMLLDMKNKIQGLVPCSSSLENKIRKTEIPIFKPNSINTIDLYIDSAEEATKNFILNKKKDLKIARAKVMAYNSREFICIVESNDYIDSLDNTTITVEVLPYSRKLVANQIKSWKANSSWHRSVLTENGNCILEVYDLDLKEPWEIEDALDLIPGVVSSSIFASVIPDVLIIADSLHAESILQNDKHELATVH